MATFSVNDQVRRDVTVGDGSTVSFPFSFQVNATTDVKVYVDDALKVAGTHYDIVDSTDSAGLNSDGTGKVKFKTTPTDHTPANNALVTVVSEVPVARTSVYTAGGNITAASLESDFDTITMQVGDREQEIARAIRGPLSDPTSTSMVLPNKTTRSNKYLAFDPSGNVTTTAGTADVTPISSAMGSVVGGATLDIARTALLSGTNISLNTANTITTLNSNGDLTLTPDGTGTVIVSTDLDVDNININANTISSTNTNGDLTLTPNGTGTVVVSTDLDVDNININGNTISSTDTNGDITLDPNGTGSVAITSANLVLTSGNGIDFSATADGSGTAASEVFDDYEEGIFTPAVSGGYGSSPSYNAQTGIYTKIGKIVVAHVRIAVSSGSRGGGALTFVGLPFANQSTIDGGGFVIYQNNFHSTGEFYPYVELNTATIFFHEANGSSVNANELDADNYDIRIALVYQTA